jgi:uncharacterized coiled-coil protein SlyX
MAEPRYKTLDTALAKHSAAQQAVEKLRSDLAEGKMTIAEAEQHLSAISDGLEATQAIKELSAELKLTIDPPDLQ